MARSGNRSVVPFVLVGLVVALVIGMVVANFAASTPDALQRAIINSACEDAPDEEACLAEAEGEPILQIQPSALFDYGTTWLSGLVGVVATFAIGTGIVFLLRRGGSNTGERNAGSRVR